MQHKVINVFLEILKTLNEISIAVGKRAFSTSFDIKRIQVDFKSNLRIKTNPSRVSCSLHLHATDMSRADTRGRGYFVK